MLRDIMNTGSSSSISGGIASIMLPRAVSAESVLNAPAATAATAPELAQDAPAPVILVEERNLEPAYFPSMVSAAPELVTTTA